MPKLTETQLNKARKISAILNGGNQALVAYLFQLEEKLEREIPDLKEILLRYKGSAELTRKDKKIIAKELEKVLDKDGIAKSVLKLINIRNIVKQTAELIPRPKDGKTPTREELQSLINPLIPDLEKIARDIGLDLEERLKEIDSKLESIPEETNIEQIITQLESRPEENKLEISAIKGLREELDKVDKIARTPKGTVGGGVTDARIRQSFKTILKTEQPSGDIDGVNTEYTVTQPIFSILAFSLNGEVIAELPNYTVSGNKITFSSAIPSAYSGRDFEVKYI